MKWKRNNVFLLCCLMVMMVACSDLPEDETSGEKELEEDIVVEEMTEEGNGKANSDEVALDEEDSVTVGNQEELGDYLIDLSATAYIEDDAIIVDGVSNLLPGTPIRLEFISMERIQVRINFSNFNTNGEVEEDGTFRFEVGRPVVDDFRVYVIVNGKRFRNEIADHYGENGENMEGPLIVRSESRREIEKSVHVETLVHLQDEEITEYELTGPILYDPPEDYGSTEIWIEADLTTDHRYVYVEGRSNLLEGTALNINYFRNDLGGFVGYPNPYKAYVRQDGRFDTVIPYSTIRSDSYVRVEASPWIGTRLRTISEEVYGENYEKMSGDIVNKSDDKGSILAKLFLDPPELEVPEDVLVTIDDGETMLTIPDDILFDYDESRLKSEAKDIIYEVLPTLANLPNGTIIEIRGHTDNTGDPDYNLGLSEERAASVFDYIIEQGDTLEHLDFKIVGFGEFAPVTSNKDENGRQRNRRVELVINPKD
ncbi:OmpA family protein [Evansella tamaricis]|uniref:OmpA family protein n=1 Tax=Evansella tamaricis TaxID=2069301 RepID=A0ABS6JDB4_9BACI|nr:OmpA family protein [Evansella tamaricis]MBU9711189.1 OmpA family protein [Evansella tamaricis]